MMSEFYYKAINSQMKRLDGKITGVDLNDAKRNLQKSGLRIIELEEISPKAKSGKKESSVNWFGAKVKKSSLIIFFRQLATMLEAGIQLVDALEILQLQVKVRDKIFTVVLEDITNLVQSGLSLSESMKQHNAVFTTFVISMVKAAESGGGLAKIMSYVADFLEQEEDTGKKIKSALSYPKFIFGFFGLMLTGIVFGLLPMFKEIFDSFGAELPLPTRLLMGFSDFIRNNIIVLIAFGFATYLGLKSYFKTATGRLQLDTNITRLPLIGNLVQQTAIIRFSLTLSILLRSGIGIIEGLKISGRVTNNTRFDQAIGEICDSISGGNTLGKLLTEYPDIFPVLEANMIAIGEKSGALPIMLEKVSEFNRREFNSKIASLTSILEPVIMGGLGVMATVIVLGLYLPIFQMSGKIH